MSLTIDSPYRCPHCSKIMMRDLGPDENGRCEVIDSCWSCGYEERDGQWRDKRVVDLTPRSPGVVASSLYRMRAGA